LLRVTAIPPHMRPIPKPTEILRYPVVAGAACLAIAVTIAWWSKVDISVLIAGPLIRRGQLWRLVTSVLPHGGILHLVFNIYWLWVFGTLVEDVYGHLKTAALIVLFAVGPNALEFAFLNGGIGLSGVGYGLFGLLWVLSSRTVEFKDAVDRRTVELFVAWFFLCIFTTVTRLMPVANIAHGAGMLLGVLMGFAIVRTELRIPAAAAIATLLCFSIWGATSGRPKLNRSASGGYEEERWGYDALVASHPQEAIRWLREAVEYQPKVALFWYNLGIGYGNVGNNSAALTAFERAAELGNPQAEYYVGTLYDRGVHGVAKDEAQALHWYERAAAQNHAEALNNLAWLYATSQNPAIRNPPAALECARRALSLGKNQPEANFLDTLAEAYYANQQYEQAVTTEQQAIAMLPSTDKSRLGKNLEKYRHALLRSTTLKRH
jgi:membrane associated rhomboid family serine protease